MTSAQLTQLLVEIGNLIGVGVAIYHAWGAKLAAQQAQQPVQVISHGAAPSSPPPAS